MTAAFADTYYFLALLNKKDQAHQKAVAFSQAEKLAVITTSWVLTELGDGLCRPPYRSAFLRVLHNLRNDPRTEIVGPSQALFDKGLILYENRPDKDWSLTDCISFVVMQERSLVEALTADHHFEQAGFKALLK
jgi:uncharacterized protein